MLYILLYSVRYREIKNFMSGMPFCSCSDPPGRKEMKTATTLLTAGFLLFFCCFPAIAPAAYHHMGESDAPRFLKTYPDKAGTKLDNCVLCHRGGSYSPANGKKVELGSCQWCHYTFGYDGKGDIDTTLNRFGKDYRDNGRSESALRAIENRDSDGDSFSNIDEIVAVRYPGDPKDDQAKVVAPYRIYTREQLLAMPQHSQFLLLNTAKALDFYAEFSGVTMEYLLDRTGIAPAATKITVYSPDGYSQGHPLEIDSSADPFVRGTYPAATYYYNTAADRNNNPLGWCDYSSPSCWPSARREGIWCRENSARTTCWKGAARDRFTLWRRRSPSVLQISRHHDRGKVSSGRTTILLTITAASRQNVPPSSRLTPFPPGPPILT
jgi:hypothetical protein